MFRALYLHRRAIEGTTSFVDSETIAGGESHMIDVILQSTPYVACCMNDDRRTDGRGGCA
jgi:hypothetical protein